MTTLAPTAIGGTGVPPVMDTPPAVNVNFSAAAKARMIAPGGGGGPFILCDWTESVFIHYQIDPAILQPLVPFALDIFDGQAYISLVAFHLKRFRFNTGGKIVAWLTGSTLSHSFLNIRTYVHHSDYPEDRGIYFLAEYLPHALNVFVGPRMFGLPYRFGKLDYHHDVTDGEIYGSVTAGISPHGPALGYRANAPQATGLNEPCESGSLDEFLLERYTAFTWRSGIERLFRVWHMPWRKIAIEPEIEEDGLLRSPVCIHGGSSTYGAANDWHHSARLVGGHYSPGVFDVWIGRPQCINGPGCATVPEGVTQIRKGA